MQGKIVQFHYEGKLTWDFFLNNINENLKRDIPRLFDKLPLSSAEGTCALVAGGPSLITQLDDLKKFNGDIFSCGTVHDFLIGNGIIPKYHVVLDPDVETVDFITKPQKEITYLLASQCHEKTFEALKNNKILMWHAFISMDDEGTPLSDFNGEKSIRGGDGVVLRAYPLASLLGYKQFHFFGFDCSFPLDCKDQHVYRYDLPDMEEQVSVSIDGNKYYTTFGLMIQLKTFITYISLSQGLEFVVHGDSLVSAVCYRDVRNIRSSTVL